MSDRTPAAANATPRTARPARAWVITACMAIGAVVTIVLVVFAQ